MLNLEINVPYCESLKSARRGYTFIDRRQHCFTRRPVDVARRLHSDKSISHARHSSRPTIIWMDPPIKYPENGAFKLVAYGRHICYFQRILF